LCLEDNEACHIRAVASLKQAWENLKKVYIASTTVHKLLLKQELKNLYKWDMFVMDYNSKIKKIYDAVDSIEVIVDE
jgi:hypothetical protein